MKSSTKIWIAILAFACVSALFAVADVRAEGRCKVAGKMRAVVAFRQPESGDVAGVSLVVAYPADRVAVPGEREDKSVKDRVQNLPSGFLSSINDGDGDLRVALASGSETLAPDARFTIEFDRCDGGPAPSVKDFACKVESASLSCGTAIGDVSCLVTLEP